MGQTSRTLGRKELRRRKSRHKSSRLPFLTSGEFRARLLLRQVPSSTCESDRVTRFIGDDTRSPHHVSPYLSSFFTSSIPLSPSTAHTHANNNQRPLKRQQARAATTGLVLPTPRQERQALRAVVRTSKSSSPRVVPERQPPICTSISESLPISDAATPAAGPSSHASALSLRSVVASHRRAHHACLALLHALLSSF